MDIIFSKKKSVKKTVLFIGENMKSIISKFITGTMVALMLGGCGFQLRGSQNVSANIPALTISTSQQYGKLSRALEAEIRAQHIADTGSQVWNLTILDQDIKQNVLAYNDSDNAAMLEIELVVSFTVTNEKARPLLRLTRNA